MFTGRKHFLVCFHGTCLFLSSLSIVNNLVPNLMAFVVVSLGLFSFFSLLPFIHMGKELKSEASFIKNDYIWNQADDLGCPCIMVSIEK